MKFVQFYHANKNPELVLVSNDEKYFTYCLNKQVIVENFTLNKPQGTPSVFKISNDDKYIIEAYDQLV